MPLKTVLKTLCFFLAAVDCANGNGGCDQICIDTSGVVECQCEEGYNLEGRSTCIGMCICVLMCRIFN